MKLGIVIPTYNRQTNLQLTLSALALQEGRSIIQVAIWDDGSSDETKTIVNEAARSFNLRYGWHQHNGYRVSLNRNRGVRLLDPDTTHVWFLDSDVVLNPQAIMHGMELIRVAPDIVIIGKYIWLPPMLIEPSDIVTRFSDFSAGKLPPVQVDYKDDIVMRDPRREDIWDCPTIHSQIGGLTLGGNLIVPMSWIRRTGGFDENIVGQGQDCDFGKNLQMCGARAICCDHIIGYHVNHYRDQAWLSSSVQETIAYMERKYGESLRGTENTQD